jgi:hypothetical protein
MSLFAEKLLRLEDGLHFQMIDGVLGYVALRFEFGKIRSLGMRSLCAHCGGFSWQIFSYFVNLLF